MAKAQQEKTRSLQELIEAAASIQFEMTELEGQSGELTPDAFVADALDIPGASKTDAERLLVDIEKPENAILLPTFRRLLKFVRQWPRTRAPRRLNHLFDEAADAHTARMRVSRESLAAAASMAVAKSSPEIFGKQTKAGAYEERIRTLISDRQALFDLIQASWQRSDVTEHRVEDADRASGLCKLTINICGGQVAIGPDLGQRAVDWWVKHHPRPVAARRLKAA